jgi:hypothetical protein
MKGNQPHPDFDYPFSEWHYYLLAKKFGWTPMQVDEQPAALLDWLVAISTVDDEIAAERMA